MSAEALNTSVLCVFEGSRDRLVREKPLSLIRNLVRRRENFVSQYPTGVELSCVEPLGGKRKPELAFKAHCKNEELVWKQVFLVASATVKSSKKPWSNLIDSEASGNYAQRCS